MLTLVLPLCSIVAQRSLLDNYNERPLGPVKSITKTLTKGDNEYVSLYYRNKRVKNSFEIWYYNRDGFFVEREHYTRGKVDSRTIITFDTDGLTSTRRNYTDRKDTPNEYVTIRKYNTMGLVTEEIDMRADTLWSRDSIVYNQYGKIAVVYRSARNANKSLYLRDAYKYDSVGNVIGERTFTQDGKIFRHCEIVYAENRTEMHYIERNGKGYTIKYFYDAEGRIVRKENLHDSTEYSDFDQYGNWRRCTSTSTYSGYLVTTTITQDIEYYND